MLICRILRRDQFIYLVFFLLLSLFLLGAGQVTHELKERNTLHNAETGRWREILSEMQIELPEKYRASWRKISREKSEKLIRAVYHIYSTE